MNITTTKEKDLHKKILFLIIFLAVIILSYVLIKPFVSAIIFGIVIAYLLQRPYNWLNKLIKKKNVSALIVSIFFVLVIGAVIFFIAQIAIVEAFDLYTSIQDLDVLKILHDSLNLLFPTYPNIVEQFVLSARQAITDLTSSLITSLGKTVTDAPILFLQMFISIMVVYYLLKDGDKVIKFIKDFLPFKEELTEKIFRRIKQITFSVVYGFIILGLIQGIAAGIGFFLFGAKSPLLFTLLATLAAIIPIVGPWIIYIPVGLGMITTGNVINGILLIVFGVLVVSTIDNILFPFIVGNKAKLNPVIVLIGMVGGLTLMGLVGLIIGPIILEFLIMFLDYYNKGELFD